ncbi:MAG: exonuclease domain-containing protein [Firmicutes bacterium]|nr:exonuclease domain-containing protein [Bacillota bacterium]
MPIGEFVAFDFETTGIDQERDVIIQMGAVRFRDGAVEDEFESLINPHRPLSAKVRRLTGISDESLAGAPDISNRLPDLLRFIGDTPLLAHNAAFDLAFLKKALVQRGLPPVTNTVYDTYELARILYPTAKSFSLGSLCQTVGVALERPHNALEDARSAGWLAIRLLARLEEFDHDLLVRADRWLGPSNWAWKEDFRAAEKAAWSRFAASPRRGPFGVKWQEPAGGLFAKEERGEPEEGKEFQPLDSWELSLLLKEGGRVAAKLAPYEYRDEQVQALQVVTAAFTEGKFLLVEAGTGTGKSLAYLIPALHWAHLNQERVIVSTHTITLQEQLWNKDLPLLQGALPFPFQAALLKGRSNYLCLARLEELGEMEKNLVMAPGDPSSQSAGRGFAGSYREGAPQGQASLARDDLRERLFLARLEVWLSGTDSGDRSELRLGREEEDLWRLVGADNTCPGTDCPHFDWCFVSRVRAEASQADLILVNHALLLSDTRIKNRLLPRHRHLILDEAHHLEEVATNHLGVDLYQSEVERLLRGLDSGGVRNGFRPGLINSLETLLKRLAEPERRQGLLDRLMALKTAIFDLGAANENFFIRLGQWAGRTKKPSEEDFDLITYTIPEDDRDLVQALLEEGEGLLGLAEALRQGLLEVREGLKEAFPDHAILLARVDRYLSYLQDYAERVRNLTTGIAGFVRWIEWHPAERNPVGTGRYRRGGALRAAPVEVGSLLSEQFFPRLRSAVLTSATLTAASSRDGDPFAHIRHRIGFDRLDPKRVLSQKILSPFNYAQQSLILINRDLPVPNKVREQEYLDAAADMIRMVLGITGGRTLVLFTSHRSLRYVHQRLALELERMGITLLGHFIDGSREKVLEEYKENQSSVLLGANSFWEGVDLPGELLTCVIMVRLPFSPPGNPVQQARQRSLEEQGLSSFSHLSLPEAILRFKQGFGRLIRRKTDRGVVLVLDPRLDPARGGYGQSFLDSVPHPAIYAGHRQEILARIAEWFGKRGDL